MKKFTTTIVIIVLLGLSNFALGYSGGSGTTSSPYQIANKTDLLELCTTSTDWSKHFIQTANITFVDADFESGGDFYNGGAGFIPIGNNTTKFGGSYNGDDYVIDNLYINRGAEDYVGLFGYLQTWGGYIQKLSVTNMSVIGHDNVGGLVGYAYFSTVSFCYSTGDVSGNENVGGLVGYLYYTTVADCYSMGTLNGHDNVGGLMGYLFYGSNMARSYSTCSVNGTGTNIGGLVGCNDYSTVRNCYASGDVSETGTNVGGLMGKIFNNAVVEYCYSFGAVSGNSNIGGLVGVYNGSTVNYLFWDTVTSGQSSSACGTGKTTTEMKTESTFTNWNFTIVWDLDSGINEGYPYLQSIPPPKYSGGDGTSGDPYQIANKTDLKFLSEHSDDWALYFIQTADILFMDTDFDLGGNFYNNGAGFTPIGNSSIKFTGFYNGDNHLVDNLYIYRSAISYIGFFGSINNASVQNLGLTNVSVNGDNKVGGLMGYSDESTISNCYIFGLVNGDSFVGGIMGSNDQSTVSICYSAGTVNGNDNIGGLVGYTYQSSMTNCYSTSDVSGNDNIGGLVGYNYYNSTVTNCYSSGSVSGTTNVGGLLGQNYNTSVNNSFWDTETSGQPSSDGGTSKTTTEMKTQSTFTDAGWNFADIWNLDSDLNQGYPYLQAITPPKYSGGSGTSDAPYQIANKIDIKYLSEHTADWTLYFIQTAEISFVDTDFEDGGNFYNSSAGFIPIGNSSINFTGSYNGGDYIIDNLYINRDSEDYIGLFGYTNNAAVQNLGVTNVSVTGNTSVGGLVGYNDLSNINTCYTTGSIIGNTSVGGLVGYNSNSTENNCYSACTVSGTDKTGGLVGYNNSSTVEYCYSSGVVSGTTNVGGLVGYTASSSVTHSFWDTETSGQSSSAGGTSKSTAEMKTQSTFTDAGWDFTNIWNLNSNFNQGYPYLQAILQTKYNGGDGTTGNPYQIANKNDLKYLSEHPADWALYFIQTADIDFADADFTSGGDFYNEGAGFIPIGNSITKFAGSYDGGNYIIDNLHISRSTKDNVGLFGYTYNASVQKLGMTNASVIGNEGVGGLMGICESSTNSYCYVSGTVSGLNYVGGMIGLNAESAVSKCYSSGTVSGNYYVGGLLGYNSSTSNVSNSYATSEVSGYSAVGGLVGKNYFATVSNCYSSGAVSGTNDVGGLLGDNYSSTVTNSFWDTQTSGQSNSAAGTSKTTDEMKTRATFANDGWDFVNIWVIIGGDGANYPSIRTGSLEPPTIQASNIVFSDVYSLQITLSWLSGDGGSSVVFAKQSATGTTLPVDNTTYTANTTFGNGTQIGATTWYCVYNGGGSTVTVSGLFDNKDYIFQVFDYNSGPGNELYLTSTASNNPKTQATNNTNPANFALSFNPTNGNYVNLGSPLSFKMLGAGSYTIEAWVKTNTPWKTIIGNYGDTPAWCLDLNSSGKLKMRINENEYSTSSPDIADGLWHHVVGVREINSNIIMYVDGSEVYNHGSDPEGVFTFNRDTYIGGVPNTPFHFYFSGEIDEVRIWNTARTQTQILDHMHNELIGDETGLVAYYNMEAGSGTTLEDNKIGGTIDGTINGSTWYSPGAPPILTWDGSESTAWETATNWDGNVIPNITYNINIYEETNNPIINSGTEVTCGNLILKENAELTIDPVNDLNIIGNFINNGIFTIESDATGTGSLIVNGTATSYNTICAQRYITNGQWHCISSPVDNATANSLYPGSGNPNIYLKYHTESTNEYTNITSLSTDLGDMKGWMMWYAGSSGITFDIDGNIRTGTIGSTDNLSRANDNATQGWNFVGNPFTSAIDWGAFSGWTKTNVGSTIYIYNGTTWATWNGTEGTGGGSRYIASGQGFFVEVTTDHTSGTLTMTKDVQVHNTVTYLKGKSEVSELVRLEVSNVEYSDETVIYFDENATTGYDYNMDAHKLFSYNESVPQISFADNGFMAINVLPEQNTEIPVDVRGTNGETLTISATEILGFGEVFMLDNYTGNEINLSKNDYEFVFVENVTNRFTLFFTTVGNDDKQHSPINIYSYNKTLRIVTSGLLDASIIVYNIMGQEISSTRSNNTITNIPVYNSGYYIIKVVYDNCIETRKVYVK